jgi:hypothetical protein
MNTTPQNPIEIFNLFGYPKPEQKGVLQWNRRITDGEVCAKLTHNESGFSMMVSKQPFSLKPKLVMMDAQWSYDDQRQLVLGKAEFAEEDVSGSMSIQEMGAYFQKHALNTPGQPRFEDFGPLKSGQRYGLNAKR